MKVKMIITSRSEGGCPTTVDRIGEYGDLLKWARIYEKHLAKGDLVDLNINISKVKETT